MKNIRWGFILLALTLSCPLGQAQVIPGGELDGIFYKSRVALVDEFMDLFNFTELRAGEDTSSLDGKRLHLLNLFNKERFQSAKDTAFLQALSFVDRVLEDSVHLTIADSSWLSRAHCVGKYEGRDVPVYLTLKIQEWEPELYSWIISKAEGEVLTLAPPVYSRRFSIDPVEHDIRFMALSRITSSDRKAILNYAPAGWRPDETSVFFSLVHEGALTLEYLETLEFEFGQVPGYVFTIRYFDREESTNSGWLIDEWKEVDL